tara:strand:- start:935 stop:1330 length:396 start_codon:yes stop_codon:yes gene_type:complete
MAKNPKKYTLKAQYNFTNDGAVGAWTSLANNIVIPDNAIVTNTVIHVVSAVTTGSGTPTLSWGIGPTGGTANRFIALPNQAYTNYSQDAIVKGYPTKANGAESLYVIWGSFSGVTGGIIDIYVSYYIGYAE